MFRVCYTDKSFKKPRPIAEPQNVEGNLLIASVQNVQTVRVVKNEGLGSEIFEHPATRLDSRRFENLTVPEGNRGIEAFGNADSYRSGNK